MNTKSSKEKRNVTELSAFSPEHQALIVKLMIEDDEFKFKAMDLIDVNSLNADECIRRIASIAKELYSKGAVYTYNTIKIYIDSKVTDEYTREKCLAYLDQYIKNVNVSPVDLNYLKDRVYPIITFQEIRRMYGEIGELVKKQKASKEDIESIYKTFNDNTSFTDCTYEEIDSSISTAIKLLEDEKYEYVPTSSKLINMALGGGLRKGDVGLLLAGSGVAKTCISTSFACWSAYHNQKVAHFVLEDKKDDILKKYIGFVTNIQPFEQHKRKDEVISKLKEYSKEYENMLSNIRAVFATKNNSKIKIMSTDDIDKELERMLKDGYIPDLVIVDYYDRIKKNGKEIWLEDERIINDLLVIATKYNVALWCPTQGGKAAQNRNIDLGLDNMSGGSYKSYGAQVAIAVQQKGMDENGTYTLTVMKNRNYPKMELKFEFNNGTCRFINEDNRIKTINESNECIDRIYEDYQYRKAMEVKNNK